MSLSFLPTIFTYQFCMKPAQKSGSSDSKISGNDLQSRETAWRCFCLELLKSLLVARLSQDAASSTDRTETCQTGGACAWRVTLSTSSPPQVTPIHFNYRHTLFLCGFNYKKAVLLTECSNDIAWCTGGARSIGVCCSDGKLILGVWEKSLENHGLHLDLLSYYCPIAVKVWPSGSKKAKIINN